MESRKRKKLEEKGWKVGTARELLGLSAADAAFVEAKARLAHRLHLIRKKRALSQTEVARRLKSSQSRVAKMEGNDVSVSLDLLVRSLLLLGDSPRSIGKALAGG